MADKEEGEILEITITPSTEGQYIEATGDVAGYSPVNVNAVTSNIDSNILPANIKSGVTILGVEGTCEELDGEVAEKTLTSTSQTFIPSEGKNGITSITVVPNNENRVLTPSASSMTYGINTGYSGNGTITVNAVTSNIDSNITAANIKSGVTILDVTGELTVLDGQTRSETLTSSSGSTFTPSGGKNGITSITVTSINQNREFTPTTFLQTHGINTGYSGNGTVTVNAVTSAIDSNIQAGNIKNGVTILGVEGTYVPSGVPDIITNVNDNYIVRTNGDIELITNGTDVIGAKGTNLPSYFLQESPYVYDNTIEKVSLSAITLIGEAALSDAFQGCTNLTSASLRSLTTISSNSALASAFSGCTALESVDLSSLTTVSGDNVFSSAFQGCTNLTSVNLSSLTTISSGIFLGSFDSAFYGCSSLTTVDLSSLTTIGDNGFRSAFWFCTGLSTVDLSSLTTIGKYALRITFQDCTSLTTLSFPALTSTSFGSYSNQFTDMLYGVTGCTVHFPSNLQSVIGSWTDVTAGFGGTNTTVLFDLPSTEVSGGSAIK